jgi:AcrR family transcriptional regulator
LQASAYILERDGWEGFNTNRVAERAGVNIASLYQYFRDKDAIVRALLQEHAEQTRRAVARVLDESPGKSMRARVRALIDATIAAHRVRPRLHRVLTEEAMRLELQPLTTDADERIDEAQRQWMAQASSFADPAFSMWIVNAGIHAIIHAVVNERPHDLDRLAPELERLVLGYVKR